MDDFLAAEILYEAGLDPEYQLHKKGMLNLYRHLHRELDDTQKEYTNVIHNSSDFVTIPITCPNADEIGGVIEALCSESYRSVVEPFYESALKSKYSRDSYSGQCIDIIRDVSVKQFLFDYTGTVKGGTMIGAEVRKNRNNFASSYAKQVEATNKNIQNLIDKYIKAEAGLAG